MRRTWSVALGLLIAAPFYWLLIDTTSSPELWAGGVAALIAAAAFSAARLESGEPARIRLAWLPAALRQLSTVPRGILIVCREVLAQTVAPRSRRGVIAAEPFETGDGDAHDLGRRALAEALQSFAPHTVVIGVDAENDRLVLHRMGGER